MGPQNWEAAHNVCTVISRENNGRVEFLTIKVRTTYRGKVGDWRIKFPGGKQEGPNETIEGTRDREVWQETGLAFTESERIWERKVNDTHTQYGYPTAFSNCTGSLRTETIVDDKSQESVDEIMGPEWIPVERLKYDLYDRHQPLMIAAMRHLGI